VRLPNRAASPADAEKNVRAVEVLLSLGTPQSTVWKTKMRTEVAHFVRALWVINNTREYVSTRFAHWLRSLDGASVERLDKMGRAEFVDAFVRSRWFDKCVAEILNANKHLVVLSGGVDVLATVAERVGDIVETLANAAAAASSA
jgi:hypothetical protein